MRNLKSKNVTHIDCTLRDGGYYNNWDFDKDLIKDVSIFDIYSGKGIDEGKKSVAVAVNIQSHSKTLTDEEIEQLSKKIISNVEIKCAGKLRV